MAEAGIGDPVRRREDKRFLTGAARYVGDLPVRDAASAAVVRSPHAHAKLLSVAVTAAHQAPGVLAVLTGADVAADGLGGLGIRGLPSGFGGAKAHWPDRPILANDRVRHVGDPIALVVAETIEAARDAAELVDPRFDVMPAAADPAAATVESAAKIWDEAEGNVCFRHEVGDADAVEAAFRDAAHVLSVDILNNRLSANPIEPRGAIGEYDSAAGRYTLRTSTQTPHRVREFLADSVFRMPETSLRVVGGDVGGGFGMKGPTYPEEALVLWAARRIGRPVRWIAERSESFMSDTHGRDQSWHAEMALDGEGNILAIRARVDCALGAYLVATSHVPPLLAAAILPGAYRCPAVHVVLRGIFTNTPTTSPYRGAGQPEAIFVTERLIERAAAEIGMSPVDIRRRNFIAADAMPYRTSTGQVYDGGDFETLTRKAISVADHAGFAGRRAQSEGRGRLRGLGIAYFVEITVMHGDRMEIRFDPSGAVTVIAGTFSHGQGHETVFPQLVAGMLGVPADRVRLIQGDTDAVGYGRGTYASRSMTVGGAALRGAADAVIARGKEIAAHLLEAAEDDIAFADGVFTVAGTDRSVPIAAVAKAAHAPTGNPTLGVGLEGCGTFAPTAPSYPNGCHVCEVEIDPETGCVAVVRYTAVDDVGKAINPLLLGGQVHGGVAQGIGQALLENVVFDGQSAQLLSASFLDYAMPRAADLPWIAFDHHDVPCRTNPLGTKGAGEAGCVGAPPAVINAVLDALNPVGVADIAMPATPERVWRAIRSHAG